MSALEKKFSLYWLALNGPKLTPEFKFHPKRRWRFDFAHEASNIAVEIEGGTFGGKSRHTTGTGYAKDCEKYNEALFEGWVVFRLTGKQITVPNLERIKKLMKQMENAE